MALISSGRYVGCLSKAQYEQTLASGIHDDVDAVAEFEGPTTVITDQEFEAWKALAHQAAKEQGAVVDD